MPMLPLLLALAAQAAPQPGPIKAFGDWVVACDNVHACEMTSLYPGDGTSEREPEWEAMAVSVARDAGPAAALSVDVSITGADGARVSLQVDGTEVAAGIPRNDVLTFTGPSAARIVAAMVAGKEMHVTDGGATMLGRVSLAGSSAALRLIDAEQGRAGTVTAAVAKGSKPASAVPAAPARPVLRFPRPAGKAQAVSPALRKALEKQTGCDQAYAGGEGEPPAVETHVLGGGATLALLPCGSGAYNFSTVAFLIRAGKPVLAPFDYPPGETAAADGTPTLVNAGWDGKTGLLSSYSKGRGLGDCGSSEDYGWDGTMFRLVEARQMIECRGSVNWLTVWKAATAN